jgi:hypothetical protein
MDANTEFEVVIMAKIGMRLVVCHEIEFYLANSFLLGVSEKQEKKYVTFDELLDSRNKKTLGNLIRIIEELYDINETFKSGLELFLLMRNKLVHGITWEKRFSFHTKKGQRELDKFLDMFLELAMSMKRIFRGCFLASMDFGNEMIKNEAGKSPIKFSKKEKEAIGFYLELFRLKEA